MEVPQRGPAFLSVTLSVGERLVKEHNPRTAVRARLPAMPGVRRAAASMRTTLAKSPVGGWPASRTRRAGCQTPPSRAVIASTGEDTTRNPTRGMCEESVFRGRPTANLKKSSGRNTRAAGGRRGWTVLRRWPVFQSRFFFFRTICVQYDNQSLQNLCHYSMRWITRLVRR